jgi:hypothetical protein
MLLASLVKCNPGCTSQKSAKMHLVVEIFVLLTAIGIRHECAGLITSSVSVVSVTSVGWVWYIYGRIDDRNEVLAISV